MYMCMCECVYCMCVCVYNQKLELHQLQYSLLLQGGEVSECSVIYTGLSYKNSIYFPSNALNTTISYFISNL